MKKAIQQGHPPVDLRVALVWTHMLPLDNAITALSVASAFRDPRVQHFDDPHRRAGAAVAASLGAADKPAWDIYLFYRAGRGWNGGLPPPAVWAHQLKGSSWADSSHYRRGDDLVRELQIAVAGLRSWKPDAGS